MKKILFFILSLFPVLFFSQDIEKAKLFFRQDKETIQSFFQSIVDETGKTYTSNPMERKTSPFLFKYTDESYEGDTYRYVNFYCNRYEIGGNPDLEIKGKEVYTLSQAKGKFLDFANWWIKYINPNETLESLSAKGKDKFTFQTDRGEETLQFLKQPNNEWIIRGY